MSAALEWAKLLLSECQHENECHANRILREAAQELVRLAAIEKLARAVTKHQPHTSATMKRLDAALNLKLPVRRID